MYFGTDMAETVSVMGTPAFMEFVESIQSEGVTFDHVPMGSGTSRKDALIVEVDKENGAKDIDALDIALPRMTRRYHRDFKDLGVLDPGSLGNVRLPLKDFTPDETREIVFKTMLDDEIHHVVRLEGAGPADYRSVIAFFARQLLQDLRLVGGYDILYGKVKTFVRDQLFTGSPVDLENPVVLRNLSEPIVSKILYESFTKGINALTIQESRTTSVQDWIKLKDTRPFRTEYRPYHYPTKSVFSKTVGEPRSGGYELAFAAFLDRPDNGVASFAKNYLAVGFKLDYVRANGELSTYTPDFIVRDTSGTVWIVETKGREELDLPRKMERLKQWCADATAASVAAGGPEYRFVYVDQLGFEKHKPGTLTDVTSSFTEYQSS